MTNQEQEIRTPEGSAISVIKWSVVFIQEDQDHDAAEYSICCDCVEDLDDIRKSFKVGDIIPDEGDLFCERCEIEVTMTDNAKPLIFENADFPQEVYCNLTHVILAWDRSFDGTVDAPDTNADGLDMLTTFTTDDLPLPEPQTHCLFCDKKVRPLPCEEVLS